VELARLGPYVVTFTASVNGAIVSQKTVSVYVDNGLPTAEITLRRSVSQTPSVSRRACVRLPHEAASVSTAVDSTLESVPSLPQVQMWWPMPGVTITGSQPFKAVVPGRTVNSYDMYWQVDNGQTNAMATNRKDAPHKEAVVDVSAWNWRGAGPYLLTFTAKDKSGTTIAATSFDVSTGAVSQAIVNPTPAPVVTQPTPTPVVQPVPQPVPSTPLPITAGGNPLASLSFYLDPYSNAANQANAWRTSRPADAAVMDTLAKVPTAIWLGEWSGDVGSYVKNMIQKAKNTTPIFVAYNVPNRDCGGYSQGGASNNAQYTSWISSLAQGIGSDSAVVILEPDGLANVGCLSGSELTNRIALIKSAVTTLKANPNTKVYIDAGHGKWVDPATMSARLNQAGVAIADGFALNVSNFVATSDNVSYGTQVSAQTGGKHFVVDTARNGNGPTSDNQWCNPSGRAIGAATTANTGNSLVDGLLWIKTPGESDGTCNGGPSAGAWWPEYALGLVQNAH
jgi:endoglucanase